MAARGGEVDWERLDKRKFFVYGGGLFSALTTCLYPLSAIKTRQMALDGAPSGLRGAVWTGRTVVATEGIRGLYAGFGTVIFGMIPARMLYMASLELAKSGVTAALRPLGMPDASVAGAASFVGGGLASFSSHAVMVPLDVVSQRQMIRTGQAAGAAPGAPAVGPGGAAMARHILATEGVRGLYRGLGASIATYVPSSAIWWSSYGVWQTLLWDRLDALAGGRGQSPGVERTQGLTAAVQAAAGVATGCTSAALTNPLDVVKTRIQTRQREAGGASLSWVGTAKDLAAREGWTGFYRGLAPRMVSTCAWGTAMVTTYEFLKRICALPPES